LKHNRFKNRQDCKVGEVEEYQEISRNIEECIRGGLEWSMMLEKEIDEIGRMGRSKKQNENVMKSKKVGDGIGHVGRTRGIWMTESRNVEADGESLSPADVVGKMLAEGAVRPMDVECRKR
jgi:hypothetical protein